MPRIPHKTSFGKDNLTKDEETSIFKRIRSGDYVIRDQFFIKNLGLVWKIARYYRNFYDVEDLFNEGCLGLNEAIDKFNYKLNTKFSTYASWWIRQYIVRYIMNKKRLIRLPIRLHELSKHAKYYIDSFFSEYRRNPTQEEIGIYLNINPERVLAVLQNTKDAVSYDNIFSNDGEKIDFESHFFDKTQKPVDQLIEEQEFNSDINAILSNELTPDESYILKSRHGFGNMKKKSLLELSDELDLSAETIRQWQIKSEKKLREHPKLISYFLAYTEQQ